MPTTAPNAQASQPTYDRSRLRTGIVHFGLGNFHRAHQAMCLDRLMNDGIALDWAVCGVGVLPGDVRMRDVLRTQRHLYTLVLKAPDGELDARVIGSVHEYLFAPDDPHAVIAKLSSPSTRIVSLTVTEGGYNTDRVTGEFDLTNADIVSDLADPDAPRTVFGFIVAGLRLRRDAGVEPFTVMSCDNIQGNGEVVKRSVLAYASALDPDLADWIGQAVSFPNSMVDRITPATTDADRQMVSDVFGIDDKWPVVAEPFVQWVLEDRFSAGRPPFELSGVQLVDGVEPYELMKLRLLNASHQAMGYFGSLLGYRYAHEAAGDPLIRVLLERYMDEEATPTLRPVEGIDLTEYKATLIQRFTNPEIRDTLARLCTDASDRIPTFLLPVVRENLEAQQPVALSAAVVASWARYIEGRDDNGTELPLVDPFADRLRRAGSGLRDRPLSFVEDERIFGDLAKEYAFTSAYLDALAKIHQLGVRAALERLISE